MTVSANINRLTLHTARRQGEERPDHCSYTADWLSNVLLVKLAHWSQQSHLNTEMFSLRHVDVESYSVTCQRLKEKYGRHLVNVSHCWSHTVNGISVSVSSDELSNAALNAMQLSVFCRKESCLGLWGRRWVKSHFYYCVMCNKNETFFAVWRPANKLYLNV